MYKRILSNNFDRTELKTGVKKVDNKCVACSRELIKEGKSLKCSQCKREYKIVYRCDKCGKEAEKLVACGSEQFFCNSCNELKSRKSIIKEYVEIKEGTV